MKAFISYSHKDESALDQLHTHLVPLQREGFIDTWFDREILAGSGIDSEVDEELRSCELFLPLVSPNFLASDYCVEREMQQALKRHEAGEIRIVPIIVEPCDWASSELRKLKALPKDGKPISEWTNPNNAYLDIVEELRRIVGADEPEPLPSTEPVAPSSSQNMSHRYRVQRDFDEVDRIDFREAAYTTIHDYFRKATDEINGIDSLRGRFTSNQSDSFSCVVVNKARNQDAAHITVFCRGDSSGLGDINYSFSEHSVFNSTDGSFYIESDEYELYLRPMLGFGDESERLTPMDAAKRLWTEFLQQAGVVYD